MVHISNYHNITVVDMVVHGLLFLISSLTSVLCWNSFHFHAAYIAVLATVSAWNGANWYMEYFSRRCESSISYLVCTRLHTSTFR